MKLSNRALRGLLDQLEKAEELSVRSMVWVRPDGSDAVLKRSAPETGAECNAWVSGGCLETILRRGIEWEG